MSSPELQSLAERLIPGTGRLAMHRLKGGLVNESYRVTRAGVDYVLRTAIADEADWGLDRAWEAKVLAVAAAAGLAPPVIYCDAQRGLLVSRWEAGKFWSSLEAGQPEKIAHLAALVRRIHALPLPLPPRTISPRGWIEHYRRVLRKFDRHPASPLELAHGAATRLSQLEGLAQGTPVLCHGDLHVQNLLSGPSALLLDWEYSHASDAFWDLAAWSCNNDLAASVRLALLVHYGRGAPSPEDGRRLDLCCWLFDYVCLLWSELYLSLRGESAAVSSRVRVIEARLQAAQSSTE